MIAAKIEKGAAVQEEAYREFIVSEKVAKDEALLEPTGLSRQLDALEKSIELQPAQGQGRQGPGQPAAHAPGGAAR